MTEMILPGVYTEVRPEGLITPGRVTVGNLGVVGTASKGPVGSPVLIGSYADARQIFGPYDPWVDGASDELTLVRALEQAFAHGATTVFAVRVASASAAQATYTLASAGGPNVRLSANSPGTWGNDLKVNVWDADEHAFIENEEHSGGAAISLGRTPVVRSARNRVRLFTDADGLTRSLKILYESAGDPAPGPGEVRIMNNGDLEFNAADTPGASDLVTASYVVDRSSAVKVTLALGELKESFIAVDGHDLAADVNRLSAWVTATALANAGETPNKSGAADAFSAFGTGANTRGDNGASGADYQVGLDALLNEEAHIIVAAGQDDNFADALDAHCQNASSDAIRRDRIAVVGSGLGADLDAIRGHNVASDRVIFVGPGVKVRDTAAVPPAIVTLPGAYAAAGIAGLLASFSAHISLTNKTVRFNDLEHDFTAAQLTQLVQSRVLALEKRQGLRVVKGITTSTNTAWHQITTRRIVDYAKAGVRSAATPYIGLLNNERVRGAMRATINSFLVEMVEDEMLISFELEVSATREEERQGIARVTLVLRPTFSIDFIKVTMFLE
ncbi:phage tail sheath subtilisin-like domain-containing protein [Geoalkalibacter halelectricus]|uniref:Phage tail sheath subtilisin-like domain-containing protein n=1 Tax=Geoalkalibacter halelectricus TaxID=2847045 RepID=A0ABY5ZQP7_9BACT|nr:phage tail sheath subtilisin-like domain-containing protein [Geoalkalibacter halelectricus]MDO3379173.1 phage tail sheath subtilisin-like domain-containing protein [Geoalkalibacter halelectricus]UWZ80933.1 phage tail sheath subtilisin-like domain-containing protein [Geoalkalibacter halelectricus]